jgi:thiamine-phosphate pyrophosphorylase
MPLEFGRLYLITDRKAVPDNSLDERVKQALAGGVRLVQLREKDLPEAALLSLAGALRRACDEFGARLIINRNLDVALECGADGLHIGAADIDGISKIKQRSTKEFLVGVSTHSVAEALAAQMAGADFVTLGPVYFTPSKTGMGEPLGPEEVGRGAKQCRIPVFALGGVDETRLRELRLNGISHISMIRAVLCSANPSFAAARLLAGLNG